MGIAPIIEMFGLEDHMRKLYGVLILAVAGTLALAGCGPTNRETATRTESGTKMSDSDLENSIKSRLNEDPSLRAADLSVSADVDKNEVKLTGTVESEALRMKAVELARSAHAGLVVTDKIDVKPREMSRAEVGDDRATEERRKAKELGDSIGDSAEDAWIHSKIVAKLIANAATPERKINVDVHHSVVTLRGTVDTAEAKTAAERIAKETDGVKRVSNQLKIARTNKK
jgi:osmotically-inducible protein OsmY